jgi:hypothetical protein
MLYRLSLLLILAAGDSAGLAASRPFELLASLQPLLDKHATTPFLPSDAALLLSRAAPALAAARRYGAAASARSELAALAAAAYAASPNASVFASLLLSRVAAVEAFTSAGAYSRALETVQRAREEVQAAAAGGVMPSRGATAALGGLHRAEAAVLNCRGGGPSAAAEALRAFERGLPPEGWLTPLRGDAHERLARDYLALLQRSPAGGGAAAAAARGVVEAALLARGPWLRADQLPRRFAPALRAQPWYEPPGPWPSLAPVVAALRAAAPALRAEWAALSRGASAAELLLPEAECIAEGADVWRYFTVNAPWVERVDRSGCSVDAPAACGLLRAAAAAGWVGAALRGTYSAVRGGGGRLRPHCGMTNAQLKLHVGLVVPRVWDAATGADAPCAWLTVGGEARAWEEGAVLMFDDSFLHSVENSCPADSERVVFQLVVPHGDAREKESAAQDAEAWGD